MIATGVTVVARAYAVWKLSQSAAAMGEYFSVVPVTRQLEARVARPVIVIGLSSASGHEGATATPT
jgi:hypothetical protein